MTNLSAFRPGSDGELLLGSWIDDTLVTDGSAADPGHRSDHWSGLGYRGKC